MPWYPPLNQKSMIFFRESYKNRRDVWKMSKASWKCKKSMQVPWSSWWPARCPWWCWWLRAVYRCGHWHRPLYTTSSRVPATERDTASPHHQLQHYSGSHTQHFMLEVKFIWKAAEKYLWLLDQLTVVTVTGGVVKMMTPSRSVSLWCWWYSHHAGPAWPGRVRRPKHNIIVTTVKKPY